MPFAITPPSAIRDRLAAEFEVVFEGADPRNRRSVEMALVRAISIASRELHGHIAWAIRQVFVADCDDDFLPVHAALCRPPVERRAALAASGGVTISGTPGETLPAGAELRRADDLRFITLIDATIGIDGTASAAAAAAQPGAAYNTAAGTRLNLIAPVAGIAGNMLVAAGGIAGGADIENPESWRARIIERMQDDADGGNAADYRAWVQDVVGATSVWVYPNHMGLGTVGVTFVMPDGSIPDGAVLAAVEAHLAAEAPVTAVLYVFAPVADEIDFEVALTPNTAANRAYVTAELADILIREAAPGGTMPLSRLSAAISSVAGEYSHVIVTPAAPIVSPPGHIARLGNIVWSA
jgi:uncharacterized phage protein gp47/JayE